MKKLTALAFFGISLTGALVYAEWSQEDSQRISQLKAERQKAHAEAKTAHQRHAQLSERIAKEESAAHVRASKAKRQRVAR